ncbi:MAG TPA: hypothetical protein VE076_13135 [Nitrososphaeraceae archaeon]|jgi:hypothetical protein|nr:hypothetical protein [Nitrososphaeraceae archaeon]
MADKTFMFIVTAGTLAGLAILLFVSRGRRRRAIKTTDKEHALSPSSSSQENEKNKEHALSPSSSSQENEKNKKGKQTKKYTSDGKLIYEEK